MVLKKVWIIPLLTSIFSLSAFIISYCIALSQEHITALWSYISDSGTLPPESCIFGQLLNLSALFFAITAYLRHRQLIEFHWLYSKQKNGKWRNYSTVHLWIGYFSAFGVSLISNFQELNIIIVHYIGAVLAFGCGFVYTWAQTFFTYYMQPKIAKSTIAHFRLFLSCLSTIFFTAMGISGAILASQRKNWFYNKQPHKSTLENPYYVEHMIATCSEWLLAICFEFYILTFVFEFRHASCHAPKLTLNLGKFYQDYQFNHTVNNIIATTTATADSDRCILARSNINGYNNCNSVSITLPIDFKKNIGSTYYDNVDITVDNIQLPVDLCISNTKSRF